MLALAASGQTPEPNPAARNAILTRMKDAAVNYADRLQDFLCIQRIKRSKEDSGPFKHWQVLDTQEREVGYISHQEHFRVLSVNGKPPGVERSSRAIFCREENSAQRWDIFSILKPLRRSNGIMPSRAAASSCAFSGIAYPLRNPPSS
jgi:hypothetical protein